MNGGFPLPGEFNEGKLYRFIKPSGKVVTIIHPYGKPTIDLITVNAGVAVMFIEVNRFLTGDRIIYLSKEQEENLERVNV